VNVAVFTERRLGLSAIALMITAVLTLGLVIRAFGIRPYGEGAILQQINHEDSALCQKFGFVVTTPELADCVLALAELRRRHVDSLVAYSWL
jgi:hypothetical protein